MLNLQYMYDRLLLHLRGSVKIARLTWIEFMQLYLNPMKIFFWEVESSLQHDVVFLFEVPTCKVKNMSFFKKWVITAMDLYCYTNEQRGDKAQI